MAYHEVPAPFGNGGTEAMEMLYPELRGRTLGQLLRAELSGEIGLVVQGFDEIEFKGTSLSPFWATVQGGKRKSQKATATTML